MYRLMATVVALLLSSGPALSQEKVFSIGNDRYLAGERVSFGAEGADDLFMAGGSVRGESAIAGSAHLAGRRVYMAGEIGKDAYVAGMDITLAAPVSGDANIAGYEVRVAEVGGDLRVSGAKIAVQGPVDGYAIIAGEEVTIDAVINGDVNLLAEELEFGEGARIQGRLELYEEEAGEIEIPPAVIPPERIERHTIEDWEGKIGGTRIWSWQRAMGGFLVGVIVIAALASLLAAIVPQLLADMRRALLDNPARSLWFGFLAESTLIGSAILLAMSIIGALLSPAMLFLAGAAGFAGYVIAAYALGVGLLMAFGLSEPDSVGDRALAAGVGAMVAGLIGLVPLFGWLFVLLLTLTGVGTVTLRLLRPGFFVYR